MLYREIIAVCSEVHTKHINTLCGQNVELLDVKPGGKYSDHWVLKGYFFVLKGLISTFFIPIFRRVGKNCEKRLLASSRVCLSVGMQ